MAAILSLLADFVREAISLDELWPLIVLAVAALILTLTGMTARFAVWVQDTVVRVTRVTESTPDCPRSTG